MVLHTLINMVVILGIFINIMVINCTVIIMVRIIIITNTIINRTTWVILRRGVIEYFILDYYF